MNKKRHDVLRGIVMITQIGIAMMVPMFLCAALGWWLDRKFQTQCWFLILLVLGIGAGFRNLYVLTRPFYEADMKKEQEKLKYIQGLKDYSKEHPEETIELPPDEGYKRYPDPKNKQ